MAFTNEELISMIANEQEKKIYKSKQWQRTRKKILDRDKHECQICKSQGKYSKADIVHHMEELKDKPLRAFDLSNLTSVCWKHHEMIHNRLFVFNQKRSEKKFMNEERW